MKTSTQPDEPAKRVQPEPDRGSPATNAAQAVRKNMAVRVTVVTAPPESDELREHGYGHGV
ncbi:MAG TPA: hypothetical protein VMO26_25760 [Vicinamibacterales bacterium]|nr:hypothetical protein [Vicinamibacterales bacterium]